MKVKIVSSELDCRICDDFILLKHSEGHGPRMRAIKQSGWLWVESWPVGVLICDKCMDAYKGVHKTLEQLRKKGYHVHVDY